MTYSVKEIFYTLQGEGVHSGRAAVFCRFAGCNLWSGREKDRSTAVCKFCDTKFVGTNGTLGGKFAKAEDLAKLIASEWPHDGNENKFVVLTGGEPLLQVDTKLIDALHGEGFEIAVETNGTILPPTGIDWLCVSPKQGSNLVVNKGNALKLVYPQDGLDPEHLEMLEFDHFLIQPMDGLQIKRNMRLAFEYCKSHPNWKCVVQTHKVIGIR
jgi:7-carboxy-7-deazaguanine synthase (Cx14CxxC type)